MNNKEKNKSAGYIGNVIANLIFLWILFMVPKWDLSFLKDNYIIALLILKINCYVQIGGNIILLIITQHFINVIVRIALELAGMIPLVVLFYLFPFDFKGAWSWLDKILPIFFIIGFVVSAIKVVTLIVRLFTGVKQDFETHSL